MYIKKYKLLWLVSAYSNQVPWHKLFGVSLQGVVENLKKMGIFQRLNNVIDLQICL